MRFSRVRNIMQRNIFLQHQFKKVVDGSHILLMIVAVFNGKQKQFQFFQSNIISGFSVAEFFKQRFQATAISPPGAFRFAAQLQFNP
jgi:hypothetical protein